MKLILIRHGETDWVREGRYQGSTDVPLNRCGRAQARSVARLIKKERPTAVYSSELTRAVETANLIARACRRRVVRDSRLNEVSFGDWEGRSHKEIRAQFPKAVRAWYSARWSSRAPGGETLRSLKQRVTGFLNELCDRFLTRQGTCVVVSHGGPIRMILVSLLGTGIDAFWKIRIDPASVSIATVDRKYRELILANGGAHFNGRGLGSGFG